MVDKNKFKGTLKVRTNRGSLYTKEYTVILFRGKEEDLLETLNGNLDNLITFCDNGFKFNDKTIRHYGGKVTPGYITERKVFQRTCTIFSQGDKPEEDSKRAYEVSVYID